MRRSCSSPGPLLKILGSILSTYEWMQLCFPVLKVSVLPSESTSSTSTPACERYSAGLTESRTFPGPSARQKHGRTGRGGHQPLGQAKEGEGTLQDEGAGLSQCCIHPKQVGCAGCWLHPCAALGLGCRAGRSPGRENWLAGDPTSSKELVARAGNCCVPEPRPLLKVPLIQGWCGQSCGTQPHRTCRTTAQNQLGIMEMQVLAVATCKGPVLQCPSTAQP